MDNDALMLWMEEKFSGLEKRISDIDKNLVGQEKCEDHRRDGIAHCRAVNAKFNTRLCRVEEICFGYEATKEQIIDESDLQEAKDDAIHVASENYGQLNIRIQNLEDRARRVLTWQTVWENPVLKTLVISGGASLYGIFLALIGVYWGRIGQYGWHIVGGFLGGIILLSISVLWAKRNAGDVKKVLKL
jgi:hypothetical protein